MDKSLEKEKLADSKRMSDRGPLFDLLIHDLTGPLSVVSTSAASLLQRASRYGPLTDEQKRLVERILRNVRKAQTMLQEMIEIARSEEGLFQKELFPVEGTLKDALMDVLETNAPQMVEALGSAKSQEEYQKLLASHGISIAMTGKYCQSPFCHDQKKVQQIFRNLIGNAMKYRRSRMEVCISGDAELCVSVEDDGVGIPLKDQEIIFERFVRLKDKSHAGIPGLGLGLTGVKALLETMNGEITLTSREGTGTRFMVRIPPLSSQ